jgi:hypothetical protein
MIAQVRSAIRLRDRGNGKRPYRLAGEQNQKERTFDVLPKPAKSICYRQPSGFFVSACRTEHRDDVRRHVSPSARDGSRLRHESKRRSARVAGNFESRGNCPEGDRRRRGRTRWVCLATKRKPLTHRRRSRFARGCAGAAWGSSGARPICDSTTAGSTSAPALLRIALAS